MAVSLSPTQVSAKHSYTTTITITTQNNRTFHQIYNNSINPRKHRIHPTSNHSNGRTNFSVIRAYIENTNPISSFANKVIGSLPIVGLIARIVNDEGGLAGDIIDFAEFRRRVGNKCSVNDSRAFYEFQERRGRTGEPLYVLLCCWLAAIGAGLLKSEEILEGVARLRLSNDIEFEEQTFIDKMTEAKERRAKLNAAAPTIPMELRAEKALDAIYVCCFGKDLIEEEDERLLITILRAVFPSVQQPEIERIVKDKARKVAEGGEEGEFPEEPKPLSKEAIQLQMKDLQFLKQNSNEGT
ncbi:photosystem I assembly factor PSA3, chloroplastic-like [Chenopodium quinoa]|uniref:photosystem I assembly factor PSA3, chloroplastic-like n=1 Tax=Chenopodium quinoa TaxID=63459 RepID=UPI000B79A3F8|nr:photosystem I assembly factor PSA3, chloroplastic-like [Chenopodium quinoa]XP_021755930.1 photosystem I assembly factor PSA3, chloroplastic-like [Chenopodium quinoa]XP_021755935.1 photosystem I assembly factor PSA3, chloroplastic-like [Chenopodium quinoa]XP_021755941.1 photosystem I assembly factor PSA3, chloroplastic-like [Chenopodium quinoa]